MSATDIGSALAPVLDREGTRVYRLADAQEELLATQLAEHLHTVLGEEARRAGMAIPPQRRAELVEEITDKELRTYAGAAERSGHAGLSPVGEERIRTRVRADVLGCGPLQLLLEDQDVETINAQGCDTVFTVRVDGERRRELAIAPDNDTLVDLIRSLANSGGQERRFDRAAPILNARLPDGSRLSAIMALCEQPSFSIRRHRLSDTTLEELVGKGLCDEELARFLAALVGARFNLLISGGMGAGKTTLLRALAAQIPRLERLLVIEDTFELGLDKLPHRHADVIALQAREANTEGYGEVSQAELLKASLRMTPDRVIVGEVRGEELIPMFNAMNLGLDGSLATLHASSSAEVSDRLIQIGLQTRERLEPATTMRLAASAIDFIVQLGRALDGTRIITSVREVCGSNGDQLVTGEVYRPGPDRRAVFHIRPEHRSLDRIAECGYDPRTWRKVVA
ncbi:CpaF family protein [Actinospica robiniae]|uniref:CpaF family protein n=1 Tax=Actinospica robiniae TaxID=304901 RepID=UPI000410AA97|nr:ATPase, T2SS/T4P/T4SS family [Actinospica robiniae]